MTHFADTLDEVEKQIAIYRFDLAAQALYEFTWNEFCDWFVELTKPAFSGSDAGVAASTRHTLLFVLEALLRALHPIIPFITEEIWHEVAPKLGINGDSIATQHYPLASELSRDATATAEIEWLKSVLTGLRRIRSEMNIAPGKAIPLLFAGGTTGDRERTGKFGAQIEFLARTESQRWLEADEAEPASATAIAGELKILIPLAGLIDIGAEKARLAKEIKRIEGEIVKCKAQAVERANSRAERASRGRDAGKSAPQGLRLDARRAERTACTAVALVTHFLMARSNKSTRVGILRLAAIIKSFDREVSRG